MSSTTTVPKQGERISSQRLLRVGLMALVITVIVNVLIRTLAVALFSIKSTFLPLALGSTIVFTIVGVLGAILVFALLNRFARRPISLFRIIAIVVLIVTLVPDIAILPAHLFPGATIVMVGVLMLEHIVTAAITVGVLTSRGRVAA